MDTPQTNSNVEEVENERELILNRIIAAGLNSLVSATSNGTHPDRPLLDAFVTQTLNKIMSCWPMLDDRIKFFVFKMHMKDFEEYMKAKIGESNV